MTTITIVYAPSQTEIYEEEIPHTPGLTVAKALAVADLVKRYPEMMTLPIGIFSERVTLTDAIEPGDRIEIYRPLVSDPKEKRRHRAQKRKN